MCDSAKQAIELMEQMLRIHAIGVSRKWSGCRGALRHYGNDSWMSNSLRFVNRARMIQRNYRVDREENTEKRTNSLFSNTYE